MTYGAIALGCECLGAEFVRQLDDCWNPETHLTRHLSATDRAACRELIGEAFHCQRIGRTAWPLVLGKHHRIAAGWTHSEFFWWREADQLVLAGIDGIPTSRLVLLGDGTWKGAPTGNCQVCLSPRSKASARPHPVEQFVA
jgi:hypothetical protein